jgi:excisionase family DNA binding protein
MSKQEVLSMSEYMSVSEYAALTGKDPGNIRRMLISGRLQGTKVGKQWVIPADSSYPKDMREKSGEYRNWRKKVLFNSNKELVSTVKNLANQLSDIYGARLSEVIVYGSYARGTQSDESDVDIALILNKKPTAAMTKKMIDCVALNELSLGKVLSVLDIEKSKYDKWQGVIPFYTNIAKEGIRIWKQA